MKKMTKKEMLDDIKRINKWGKTSTKKQLEEDLEKGKSKWTE